MPHLNSEKSATIFKERYESQCGCHKINGTAPRLARKVFRGVKIFYPVENLQLWKAVDSLFKKSLFIFVGNNPSSINAQTEVADE